MIVGLKELNVKLDKLGSKQNAENAMREACLMVEGAAKLNAPVGPTNVLRNSITSEWTAEEGRIGTNLEYAPYVHQGTGIYAVNGDGRQTPWLWYDAHGYYTGTNEAGWMWTVGQQPQPFLVDAFEQNQEKIAEIFKTKYKEAVK